jgi:two-component system LytT family response regulator
LRALIVDDEPLARENLRLLLADAPDVTVAGECRNGREAVAMVPALRPDVVFLDIRMPVLGGFAVVEALGGNPPPLVVFVTAHDAHAVEAFGVNAVDYLLKPFDDRRFSRTLDRLRWRLAERARTAGPMVPVPARPDGPADAPPRVCAERLVIREIGRIRFVRVADIDWIQAESVYCRLHTGTRSALLRSSMDRLERLLDPACFLRLNRSTIVQVDRVTDVCANRHSAHQVVLRTGAQLSISRRRRRIVDALQAALAAPAPVRR